jgi:hypothetical protein
VPVGADAHLRGAVEHEHVEVSSARRAWASRPHTATFSGLAPNTRYLGRIDYDGGTAVLGRTLLSIRTPIVAACLGRRTPAARPFRRRPPDAVHVDGRHDERRQHDALGI